MYVCMCLCGYIDICISCCVYIYTYSSLFIYTSIFTRVYKHTHTYINMRTYASMYDGFKRIMALVMTICAQHLANLRVRVNGHVNGYGKQKAFGSHD